MPVWIPIAAVVLLLGYLLLRFNRFWIYSTFDRATRRPTDRIPDEYDRPRYLKLNSNGEVDTTVRWPGWDGWYFFILPRDTTLPVKMIRSSLMTGLYGLEGIDNYERLLFRLSTFDAVEYLSLTPTAITTPAGVEQRNNLSQHYFPRRWHLWMQPQKVDIAITGQQIGKDEEFDEYGRIRGAWPDYHVKFLNPEAGISCSATFRAENVVWWADVSGVFTYFAIFGQFEGQIKYALGTKKTDPHKIEGAEEVYPVSGAGCLEHGFARKLFAADRLFLPVRLLNRVVPSYRPIRYHYELFIGDGEHRGGFMQASAFGINVRDRGGLFWEGRYIPIHSIRIRYSDDPQPDLVAAHCPNGAPVVFYRRWFIRAETAEGPLEYAGTREWPPAAIATNMTFYNFSYEGSFKTQSIRGRGYGEYVHT